MEPVRVLHIVANMNRGGIENFIMNIYRKIDREKVQFDFLVTREVKGIFDEEIKTLGGKIYNIAEMSKVGYLNYKKNVRQFFEMHPEYQMVHCHRDALGGIYLREAYRMNIPVRIAHSHTSKIGEPPSIKGFVRTMIKAYFKPLLNRYSTQRLACGKEAGEWLFGKKYEVQVINNGVDVEHYSYRKEARQSIRDTIGVDEDTFLLGHVGRFYYPKNHKFLIQVFKEVTKHIPNCILCLVGEGELHVEIKEQVSQLGLAEKVIFLGGRDDVDRILSGFDLFLFPSLLEGIPVTLVEAQASGLHCLVSNHITQEADLQIGLVKYLSIYDEDEWVKHITYWAQQCTRLRDDRKSCISEMRTSGYNIEQSMRHLQNLYTTIMIQNGGDRNATDIDGIYTNV